VRRLRTRREPERMKLTSFPPPSLFLCFYFSIVQRGWTRSCSSSQSSSSRRQEGPGGSQSVEGEREGEGDDDGGSLIDAFCSLFLPARSSLGKCRKNKSKLHTHSSLEYVQSGCSPSFLGRSCRGGFGIPCSSNQISSAKRRSLARETDMVVVPFGARLSQIHCERGNGR